MYYAFFETGDEEFFKKLIDAFCSTYVHNIVDIYAKAKQDTIYKLDSDKLKKIMSEERESLNIFNCTQHLKTADCPNAVCVAGHTTVLAKDQHEKFGKAMEDAKKAYRIAHYSGDDYKVWLEIQYIFNNHNNVEFFGLKTLSCESTDSVNYIEETNKLDPAEGYVYVRSSQNSKGYKKFRKNTKLPKKKIVPCDILQTVK